MPTAIYVDTSHPRVQAALNKHYCNNNTDESPLEMDMNDFYAWVNEHHNKTRMSSESSLLVKSRKKTKIPCSPIVESISAEDVDTVNNDYKKIDDSPLSLEEAMTLCSVIRKEELPNPEWDALSEIEKMRLKGDERQYQRMVKSITALGDTANSYQFGNGLKEASKAFGLAGNLIVAFIGAFLCGWFLCETFIDSEDISKKAVLGGICSFFTLILEAILLILRDEKNCRKEKYYKEQEKRKWEASSYSNSDDHIRSSTHVVVEEETVSTITPTSSPPLDMEPLSMEEDKSPVVGSNDDDVGDTTGDGVNTVRKRKKRLFH